MPGPVPSPRAIRAAPVALALALAALAAGCGGEPVEVEGRTLRLRLDEYGISPQDVKVSPGRAGVVAPNAGRLTHNVRVVRQGPDDAEAPRVGLDGTRTAQPGESVPVTIDLRPGEYRVDCTIANHDDLGQYGTLVVER